MSKQHTIEHARQNQLKPDPEDVVGHAPEAHEIIFGGHPGSTFAGTVTPFTQESQ